MDKYNTVKTIGDGTYGSVIKAMNRRTGEIVAIKKMKKKYFKWNQCIDQKEIQSLIKLSHPNIVKLYEVILEKNILYFVFEFLDQNVYEIMKERKKLFPEPNIRNIMFQTLQGLAYMHKKNYMHRDLKPENLLCYNQTVKIADFGLAKECDAKPPFTDYVSTRWYRAPEILLRSPNYNAPIDIFALGAIMVELFTMRPLFPGQSEQDQMRQICKVLGTPSKISWPDGYKLASQLQYKFPQYLPQSLNNIIQNASEEAIQLMKDMMLYDPAKRPTAEECLQYPFFQVKVPVPMNAPEAIDMEASQLLDELNLDDQDSPGKENPMSSTKKMSADQLLQRNNQRQKMVEEEKTNQYASNAQGFGGSNSHVSLNEKAGKKVVSSLAMMMKARYKPEVETSIFNSHKLAEPAAAAATPNLMSNK